MKSTKNELKRKIKYTPKPDSEGRLAEVFEILLTNNKEEEDEKNKA